MTQTGFRFLLVIVLILGVFFRFVNLDKKVYWHDEAYTSLRISGYNGDTVVQQVFTGQVIAPEDLLKFQRISSERTLADAIHAFIEHPEHPPLYYLIARFWGQRFGNSVATIRSLSALISLLVFPGIYWLCWELFDTPILIASLASILLAISPFHVLYAQEARQSSLATVTILLSGGSLLRAIRLQRHPTNIMYWMRTWGLYVVALAMSFYTFLFSAFVGIGHGIYVMAIARFRWTKTVASFWLASLLALLLFLPWIWVIITHFSQLKDKTSWTTVNEPLSFLITMWGLHLSSIFVDFGLPLEHLFTYTIPPILLIFVAYCIYLMYRQNPLQVWLFILTLIGVTALGLILPDLILGGRRSIASRYFITSYLGIHLAVAYLFATQISNPRLSTKDRDRFKPRIWSAIIAVLITSGVISCAISSQADTWWNKAVSYNNAQIAKIINSTNHPLVISDNHGINVGNLLSLSHLLQPKVRLVLVVQPHIPQIPDGFSDVFLFNPSSGLLSGIEKNQNSKLELVEQRGNSMWKIKSN